MQLETTRVIVPVAAGLRWGPSKMVVPDRLTALACDHSLAILREKPSDILVSAGYSLKYKVGMADVMRRYILDKEESAPVSFEAALTFNTQGEVGAAATHVLQLLEEGAPVNEVCFVAEAVRAKRVMMLARHVFPLCRVPSHVHPKIYPFIDPKATVFDQIYRRLYEDRAYKNNLARFKE